MSPGCPSLSRRRLVCRGIVQGVGFRPAVCRLGQQLGLDGSVRNDAEGATIEVQGDADSVATFVAELPRQLPPLARLDAVEALELPPIAIAHGFVVGPTAAGARGRSLVPADVVLCAPCRAELDDPRNRRHRHPFLGCTDCGPRFTVVQALPYDRDRTSMAPFPLCARCAAEFADPRSRRFRAESICCPDCGPRVRLATANGGDDRLGEAALVGARRLLADGAIVAIKGLGGFQLACRADDAAVVARLRQRKQRPRKPFAVMVPDLANAHRLVELAPVDEALLTSAAGPIVLAPVRATAPVAAGIAPGSGDLGVLLPTTALHVELFRGADYGALVMTSGNCSDEPIQVDDDAARLALANLADAFVLHDRTIVRRADDSVVRTSGSAPVMVRRSRGHTPLPLRLPPGVFAPEPLLAVGGHLQTTLCIAVGDEAFLSPHIGDLDHEQARAFHREVGASLEQFLEVTPRVVIADSHPDYPSRWRAHELATRRRGRLVLVPHHLAHAAAALGEHGAFPTGRDVATALVLDGTGIGPDGAAWGAELLQCDGTLRWARAGHGEGLPLPGGEAAVREPARLAIAVLSAAGLTAALDHLPLARLVAPERRAALAELANYRSWPLAHGAGRLFEAAGALLGLVARNDHEGEAAAALEALAARATDDERGPAWPEVLATVRGGIVPHRALLLAAAQRLLAGASPAAVAFGLHRTYVAAWLRVVALATPGTPTLALGGGCFVNRLLRAEFAAGAAAIGLRLLPATVLPPGDGGLAYGQAVLGAVALARGVEPTFVDHPLEP